MPSRPSPRTAPTSRDVASLAGVSQSTVSYVMSGSRPVAEGTRLRVQAAMQQLGYQPNAGARALRGQRTQTIALVVQLGEDPAGTTPYIDTIVEVARGRDYDVVLLTANEGPAGLVRLAGRSICDAFVLMDIRTHDDRIKTAASLQLPVVLMGAPADANGLDAVDFDARTAARLLVDELADTGHRHVVLIGDGLATTQQFRFVREFQDGARVRAAQRGLQFELAERERSGWVGLAGLTDQLLRHRQDRLGFITRTPQVTEWLLQLLALQALTPGEDVSIVGLLTDEVAAAYRVAVTNVSPEPRDQSRLAMQVLFGLLDGAPPSGELQLVPPRPVTRRSSTTPQLL